MRGGGNINQAKTQMKRDLESFKQFSLSTNPPIRSSTKRNHARERERGGGRGEREISLLVRGKKDENQAVMWELYWSTGDGSGWEYSTGEEYGRRMWWFGVLEERKGVGKAGRSRRKPQEPAAQRMDKLSPFGNCHFSPFQSFLSPCACVGDKGKGLYYHSQ
ncbi:hypothetical protein Nepgr_026554 [Nepenthes gracilis]|uniref:Uncharacterized protein n=1 Tax=Nepenthes gracilis TaxID=150966 RepID=A0AAD3T9Z2_NEPGR|nr:hypothetical protein Nepgr_026554 [Nepenthes gracilis]